MSADDARILWVAAHPDDESMAGPVLAHACIGLGRPCAMVVLNRGDGGECSLREGCKPSLGELRAHEMSLAAGAYGAELHHHAYFNAPLPVSSFPKRHEIATKWASEGDPAEDIARVVLAFKPTVLVTFDPNHGFTGHPEHQLAARFAKQGVERAAKRGHTVKHWYWVLNRFWLVRMFGGGDPTVPSESLDGHVPCGRFPTCLDAALDATRAHRTQDLDMQLLRRLRPQLGEAYLYRPEDLLAEDPELSPFAPAP